MLKCLNDFYNKSTEFFFKWKSENKLVENLGMVVNSLCSCQYLPDSVNTSVSDWRSIRRCPRVCSALLSTRINNRAGNELSQNMKFSFSVIVKTS